MKNDYSLNFKIKVIFGCKKRFELHDELALFERKMLICGKHFAQSPVFKELFGNRNDYIIHICSGGEPTLEMVEAALDIARKNNVNAVIAAGGGSVMDAGKSVAALALQQGSVRDYFYNRLAMDQKRLFFAAMPTTAGTGAEVTPNAVLTDEANGLKQSLRGSACGVDLAIVDPELTYDCPLHVIQQSGMDSLTQAIEGVISAKADNATFAWSMQAFKLVFENLQAACDGDLTAKNAVAEGTMLGALAFTYSGLGAVHGLAHPIGSLYHLPHGLVCGILLPHILKINRDFLGVASRSYYGIDGTADKLINDIEKLAKQMNIPFGFKGILQKQDFKYIIENCRSGSMKCNPVYLSDDDIRDLLEKLA